MGDLTKNFSKSEFNCHCGCDNDGILDTQEGEGDLDQDGFPNRVDSDSDGDFCSDVVEAGLLPDL